MKILVVVDMQNDFVTGPLGTPEAQALVPKIDAKIKECREDGYTILFTRDTHHSNYLETQEGRYLPVKHCMEGSPGWCLVDPEWPNYNDGEVIDKTTFGSMELVDIIDFLELDAEEKDDKLESVELCGVCTGICVISNAVLLKSYMPEVPIIVHKDLCACATPESHELAIEVMKLLQIQIVGEYE